MRLEAAAGSALDAKSYTELSAAVRQRTASKAAAGVLYLRRDPELAC